MLESVVITVIITVIITTIVTICTVILTVVVMNDTVIINDIISVLLACQVCNKGLEASPGGCLMRVHCFITILTRNTGPIIMPRSNLSWNSPTSQADKV